MPVSTIQLAKAAILAGPLFLAGPALASPSVNADGHIIREVSLRTGDLDLVTDAGAAELDRRLARAARSACGPVNARDLNEVADFHRCVANARDTASAQAVAMVARARSAPLVAAK